MEADPSLVSWLLQELLANAIRFGRPPAQSGNPPQELRVHVSSGAEAGHWFVSVADNGRGIEPAMVERVFRPFKKLEAGPSAGLGLTICRRIVERHEGQIWIETGNRGAEFRFFLGSTGRGEAAL